MRNLIGSIAVILSLGLAACAHTSDNPRARDGGRAAGAGGSHAPGSTGLGAGTMGVENSARIGSGR